MATSLNVEVANHILLSISIFSAYLATCRQCKTGVREKYAPRVMVCLRVLLMLFIEDIMISSSDDYGVVWVQCMYNEYRLTQHFYSIPLA